MGFLDWFKSESSEAPDSQLSLLGQSQSLPEKHRVDRAEVLQDFQDEIQKNGGSKRAYPLAIDAETRELFGCTTQELYQGVGGKLNNRDTLPRSAQKAYMHNEIDCTQQLKQRGRPQGSQGQRDRTIVHTVRERSKQNKRLWEWNQ